MRFRAPDYLLALPDFNIPGYVALADLFDEGMASFDAIGSRRWKARYGRNSEGNVPVLGLPALLAVRALDRIRQRKMANGGRLVDGTTPALIPFYGPPGHFHIRWRLLEDGAATDLKYSRYEARLFCWVQQQPA